MPFLGNPHPELVDGRGFLAPTRRLALAGLLGAGACAPLSQHALIPTAGFAGPRLEGDAMVSFDGARLPMTVWPALGGEPWAVVIALHGMNDYAEAFTLAGPVWAAAGVTTYAYDQRGFGRGPGRGVWGGEGLMVEDLPTACTLARARHPNAIIAVVGESMGGAVAIAAFASKTPPDADRLVLMSPAVWGWGEQPIPNNIALWLGAHIAPGKALEPPRFITNKIRATDNIDILRRMSRDRNLIFSTRIDAIYGLVGLMQDAQDDIGRLSVPTLYQYGAHDQIIPRVAAEHAAAKLGPSGRSAWYADGWHILNRDLHRDRVLEDALGFLRDPTAPLPSGAPRIPHAAR
jgi:alpha-beta hydrolase superfamily lysophospholipase